MLDDYDGPGFDPDTLESLPRRGDVLLPMQLPPLPTTRSQRPQLDISQGGREAGETSGEGGSSDGHSSGAKGGAAETPTTSRPSWVLQTTTGSGPQLVDIQTPEPGRPAGTREAGTQPAVVFKEDVAAGTGFDLDAHLVPVDEEASDKPPFHLIIVNVKDHNQSVNNILDILNQPVMGVAGSPFSQITDLSRVTSAAVQGSGDAPPLDPPPSVLFVNGKHEVV
ncbi:hypothetical protein EYF80_040543 [Liparis tanakae]|uniref:Uncharacterized protein n=1 Tax=Liparis tanakae TaxID=230148 RepID=A0A4Z2G859_9TELE|nr:hypothetical protein EYF80_040543 [Liparis tanakae]